MSIGIVNKLDTPWGFTKDIQQDNWHIQYTNLNEICQGGPLVGNLIVNGQKVFCDKRFGGPLLYHENLVFIPMYIRKFCISGFMLSVIELNSMRLIRVKSCAVPPGRLSSSRSACIWWFMACAMPD